MLFELIHKIHERPLHERRRIAFWSALVITLCIVAVWGITLLIRSANTEESPASTKPISPFESVWGNFQEGFDAFKQYLPGESTE